VRRGVRIGVDVGSVRVGIAVSDPDGRFAVPRETLRRGRGDLDQLAAMVADQSAIEVVVGWPRSLSGAAGPAADEASRYARALARRVAPVPVVLHDERLSTVAAPRELRGAGWDARRGRAVIDQAAAAIIRQSALDAERISGSPAGPTVQVEP
jgi:putative pre-16S rRNA nuclease